MLRIRWTLRQTAFKIGFGVLLLAIILSIIAFIAPAWQNTGGLWMYRTLESPAPVWFQVVRVLETFGLAVLVLGASLEVYSDVICRLPTAPADNPAVELLASLGGLVGLAGVVLFAAEVMTYPPGLGPYRSRRILLFWAWGLQAAGSLLALLSAVAMGCSREKNSRVVAAMTKMIVIRHKMASEGVSSYIYPFEVDMAPPVRVTPVVPNQWDSHV